jgi:hypothetical protein
VVVGQQVERPSEEVLHLRQLVVAQAPPLLGVEGLHLRHQSIDHLPPRSVGRTSTTRRSITLNWRSAKPALLEASHQPGHIGCSGVEAVGNGAHRHALVVLVEGAHRHQCFVLVVGDALGATQRLELGAESVGSEQDVQVSCLRTHLTGLGRCTP